MTTWTERAKACFSQKASQAPAKTDERGVLSVSSVPTGRLYKFPCPVSSVSSVGVVGLFENCIPADELIAAAMRACDYWNDNTEAREQMRRECLETPAHLRADLMAHFERQYPKGH